MFGAFAWFPWIATSIISFVNKDLFRLAVSTSTLIFWVSVIFMYVRIFLHGRRALRECCSRNSAETTVATTSSQSSQLTKQQILKDKKLARSCIMVVICHFMCYVPSFVTMGLLLGGLPVEFMIFPRGWTLVINFLNSSLNSVLFFWVNVRLRSEAAKIVRGAFNRGEEKYRTTSNT